MFVSRITQTTQLIFTKFDGMVADGSWKKPLDFGGNLSLRFNGHFPGEPGLASVY